jgi:hypothetical protein
MFEDLWLSARLFCSKWKGERLVREFDSALGHFFATAFLSFFLSSGSYPSPFLQSTCDQRPEISRPFPSFSPAHCKSKESRITAKEVSLCLCWSQYHCARDDLRCRCCRHLSGNFYGRGSDSPCFVIHTPKHKSTY